jgi:hypothetical protein
VSQEEEKISVKMKMNGTDAAPYVEAMDGWEAVR